MPKRSLKKEKWTLSFDPLLKKSVIEEAQKNGVYPIDILEKAVRDHLNPFGYTEIENASAYVRNLRKESRSQSEDAFLNEVKAWQKPLRS